jgi:hypothetical protein
MSASPGLMIWCERKERRAFLDLRNNSWSQANFIVSRLRRVQMTLSLKVMSLQTEQTLPKAIAVAPFAFEMSFVKAAE